MERVKGWGERERVTELSPFLVPAEEIPGEGPGGHSVGSFRGSK